MINYYKNTSKIETQLINNERTILSFPNDIRSTEVLVRQYETEHEKMIQTYEQCRQDAIAAENKAKQVKSDGVEILTFEISNNLREQLFRIILHRK